MFQISLLLLIKANVLLTKLSLDAIEVQLVKNCHQQTSVQYDYPDQKCEFFPGLKSRKDHRLVAFVSYLAVKLEILC